MYAVNTYMLVVHVLPGEHEMIYIIIVSLVSKTSWGFVVPKVLSCLIITMDGGFWDPINGTVSRRHTVI